MSKSSKITRLVVVVIAISLVMSFSFSAPKKAGAWLGIWDTASSDVAAFGSWVSNVWSEYLASEEWWKEWILDPIAYAVAQEVLSNITESTVNWINNGFEGGPLYDVNFGDSIKEGLNEASGIMADKLSVGYGIDLCENIAPSLRLSFSYQKPFEYKMKCTLNDVIDNIEDFYQDFTKGGWKGWVTLTTQPQNNPYGAYIESAAEYERLKSAKTDEKKTETTVGGGFKSFKKCDEYTEQEWVEGEEGITKKGTPTCKHWSNQTPGKTIEARLSLALGADISALGVADEMGEIIGALLQTAMKAIFEEGESSDGLSGSGAVISQKITPATLAEDMVEIRTLLQMYYDYFVTTSPARPNGTHYLIREEIWILKMVTEKYWRLAQYCTNGCSLDGDGVSGVEFFGKISSAAVNVLKADKMITNTANNISLARGLYSDGITSATNVAIKGVYDPFFVNAGWGNVTSDIIRAWKSKLSELQSIQSKDDSDLKMALMEKGSAKSILKDRCINHDPIIGVIRLGWKCNSATDCKDIRKNNRPGEVCDRGDVCEGGEMRPARNVSFCCVGGSCVPDPNNPDGYGHNRPIVATPEEECADTGFACSSETVCCDINRNMCGHLEGGENHCFPKGTDGVTPATEIQQGIPSDVKCDQANYKYLMDEPDAVGWAVSQSGDPDEADLVYYNGGTLTKNTCGGVSSISGPGWAKTGCPGYVGGDALYLSNYTGIQPDSSTIAKWTPSIGKAGPYKIYVSWRASENRASKTKFDLHLSNGGNYSFTFNQKEVGEHFSCDHQESNYWALLGTYDLDTGTGNYVQMKNGPDHSEGIDAAAFIYVGDSATDLGAQ